MGVYNANTNWNNERSYLNGLISKGGGNAEWAKKQMNELNKAQQQYGGSSNSSGSSTSRQPSSSNSNRGSSTSSRSNTGTSPSSGGANTGVYNENTNWANENSYLNGLIAKGGGSAEWAKKQLQVLQEAQKKYAGGSSGGSTVRQPSSSGSTSRQPSYSGGSQSSGSGGSANSGVYNENTNWENERSYLNGLISKGGGSAEWAKKQMEALASAQQKYTGIGGVSDEELRSRYFPGYDSVPSGLQDRVDLAAGTVRAPNGDILSLHDWSTDTTDYGNEMLNAKDIYEFREAAQARVNKANAQGIDIYGNGNARTNEDLYNEWRKNSGYDPKLSSFVSRGYGLNKSTGEIGWVDNFYQNEGYYGMDGEGHWGYYADPDLTQKLEKGTWDDYASSDGGYVRMDDRGTPDMTERDMSRAGQTVILTSPKGTFRCTYNDNGYMTGWARTSTRYTPGLIPAKADNDAGVSSEELMNLQFGHSYTGPGSTINDKDITAASRSDYEKVMASRGQSSVGDSEGMGGKLPDASGLDLSGLLSDALYGSAGGSSSGNSSSGGSYSGGNSGGEYDLTEWIKKQYESALEEELAGLKEAYEKNTASLDDEESRLSGIYDPQRNRIAAQNALAKRAWDERAAANGLSSGANGQAELARSSAMQRDLASIGEEESNARADISLRKKELTITYTNAIAEAKANGQYELAKALYNELIRAQGLEREDQIRESENALKQAQAKMEYDLALKQMEADSAAASQTTAKPSLTASQAYTAYKNGIRTNEVMTAMEYYYGIGGSSSGGSGGTSGASGGTYSGGTSGKAGKTGKTTTTPSKTTTTGKVRYDNGGLTSAQIKKLQQDLNKYLPTGKKIAVDGYWGPATKAAAGGATAKNYYYAWLNQQQKNSGLVNKQERT